MVNNGLEQRRHVTVAHIVFQAGVTIQRAGVHHRKVELRVATAQVVEQLEHLIDYPIRPRARAINLVDHNNRLQTQLKGLGRHKARLRHRAVNSIDQQDHRIDHGQHALDLATEVGVTGRIDDIEAVVAPLDRRVLRQDGDPALAFEVVAVHHPLALLAALGQGTGLTQQLVHQRGLAVVNVGDDGDVAQLGCGVVARHGGESGDLGARIVVVIDCARRLAGKSWRNKSFTAH